MSEEKKESEDKIRIKGGYSPEERGYKPAQNAHEFGYQSTQGNIDVSNPPQGGSGVPQNPSSSSEKPDKKE